MIVERKNNVIDCKNVYWKRRFWRCKRSFVFTSAQDRQLLDV